MLKLFKKSREIVFKVGANLLPLAKVSSALTIEKNIYRGYFNLLKWVMVFFFGNNIQNSRSSEKEIILPFFPHWIWHKKKSYRNMSRFNPKYQKKVLYFLNHWYCDQLCTDSFFFGKISRKKKTEK